MQQVRIDLSNEELLAIIRSPGYGEEVIFAEGYELPAAYPPPEAGTVQFPLPWSALQQRSASGTLSGPWG